MQPNDRIAIPSDRLAEGMDAIREDSDIAVDALAQMVAIDTSLPPGGGTAEFADLMKALVSDQGFETKVIDVPESLWTVPGVAFAGPRRNLVARRQTGKPACGLYFHIDTVPAAPGWTRKPFELGREGSTLYGLGAADMKGTIAAVLLALRAAERCGVELAYDPVLLFCTDEEGGLYPGVRYLAEQGELPRHIVNFNGTAAPRIWAGSFGLFNLLVRLRGRTVHAGEGNRTGKGVNAIEQALPLLGALVQLKQQVAERRSNLPPPPHADGPLRPQLSIAAANGGTSGGQVPSLFEILVSRRYAPEEDFEAALDEVLATVTECTARVEGLTVETRLAGHLAPTGDPGGPHWPRWQQALAFGFRYAPEDFARWGAASCSDFGWVQRAGVTQEVLLGGLGRPESCVHSPDEHTTIEDIVALSRSVLAYLATDFAPDLNPDITPSRQEG